MRHALWGLALGLLVAVIGKVGEADELRLKDGVQYEGKVVEESDTAVVFEITNGVVTGRVRFDRGRIATLVKKETARERAQRLFTGRKAELEKRPAGDAGAVEAWFDLARVCRQDGLDAERVLCLERVLALAPDHEFARTELGFVRAGGAWLTAAEAGRREEEALRAKGYVKVNGEWLSHEAVDQLIALEKAKAEARADRMEQRIRELETRVTAALDAGARAANEVARSVDRLGAGLGALEARLAALERNEGAQAAAYAALQADLCAVRRELDALRARAGGPGGHH